MPKRMKDRVALVTGGANGIGAAIVRRFHLEGAIVVAADLEIEVAQELVASLGDRTEAQHLDVTNEAEFKQLIQATAERHGGLNILVNNAGVALPAERLENTLNQDFERFVDVNLRGAFYGCKHAWPHLRKCQGNVLNISSMVGVVGQAEHAIYGMTKGGLNGLTKSVAVDWGPERVRINALAPAGVRTRLLEEWLQKHPDPEQAEDYLARTHSLGYCASADQVASVAAFLCSDDASFVTGAIVPVSGGSECGYKL